MTIDKILHFRSPDSTADINARLSGLIPKGILKGGIVVPEPDTLQVRIIGAEGEPWVFLAFASDGMLLRDTADEIVLPVLAGTTNVIVLRAKYIESGEAIGQAEVMTLGAFNADPDPNSLIRLASVTPDVGSTAVLDTDIDLTFRDSIEGFTRSIVREVVDTKADLPAVSGFPSTAEINFIANDFVASSSVTIAAGAVTDTFPIVPAIAFNLAAPSADPLQAGLSRINPSQATIVSAIETALTGVVLVTTSTPHGYSTGNQIRVTSNSAPSLNGVWVISNGGVSSTQFEFIKPGTLAPVSGTGGNVVNTATLCTVFGRTAPGVIHNLVPSQPIIIKDAIDPSFNVASTVASVIDGQTFTFTMVGFPTANSGGGQVVKIGVSLPANGVQIGSSATETASNFASVFLASATAGYIHATAIGSSIMFQAINPGSIGNTYTLAKSEPGILPGEDRIVLSGPTFEGGADPVPSASPVIDLRAGDLYVVLFGDDGTLEIWGYDGFLFKNLTSSSFGTLLDFHRRNLFLNEIHLTENQRDALKGTVGTPSATNLFVTQQDTSVLSADIAAALVGADNVAPSASNRYLTEARYRGERGEVSVPSGQNWVQLPPADLRWVVGNQVNSAIEFFNVVFTSSLNDPGGPTEYTQLDFTPVTATAFYNNAPFIIGNVLNPADPVTGADALGIYPHTDAAVLGNPTSLYVVLSAIPNNGSCTVLYSRAAQEKVRKASSDMLANPQRILPADIADIKNKVSELTFNTGIGVSGTSITFPANLFVTTSGQQYTLRRSVGGRVSSEVATFTIDFSAGTGTSGIVNPFTPVTFTGSGVWTRYLLTVTQEGVINVYPLADYVHYASDLAYASSLGSVAVPNVAFTKGEWLFASVGVHSTGVATIANLVSSSVELYPYQSTNSRDASSPIVCGDATTSFGHFSGPDAIQRAVKIAAEGDTIKVLPGTYIGQVLLTGSNNDKVTLEFCDGASLQYQTNRLGDKVTSIAAANWDFNINVNKVLYPSHGLLNNQAVTLTTSGSLPSGLSTGTTYYVIYVDANHFQLSLSIDGPAEAFIDGGTGFHAVSTNSVDIPAANWNTGTYIITSTAHGLTDNLAVKLSPSGNIGDVLPTNLTNTTTYYIINATANTFQLSQFIGGSAETFSTQGVGTHTVNAEHTCIIVNSSRVRIKEPRFSNCDLAIRLTDFADEVEILNPQFESTVVKNFDGASALTNPNLVFKYSNVATYTCTDGLSTQFVGDFNSYTALQDAHDAASPGDTIILYPGNYRRVNWSVDNVHLKGHGPGLVTIDGEVSNPAIVISGEGNFFENLVCDNASVGIQCAVGAIYNTFASSVVFSDTVVTDIEFPSTLISGIKHHNFHPMFSGGNNPILAYLGTTPGTSSRYVTVGDGVSSWGDYVGVQGINQALAFEQSGTTIRVGKGTYSPIVFPFPTLTRPGNYTLEGSGDDCIIQADWNLSETECINVFGDNNKISGFHLDGLNNVVSNFNMVGVRIGGNGNVVSDITFTETGFTLIAANKKYAVDSGSRNRFLPHTGAATDVISWTVGDGVRSFGDFVGPGSISEALTFIPKVPSTGNGTLSSPVGSTITFTDTSAPTVVNFDTVGNPLYINALNRYITLDTGANQGTWKVTAVLGPTSLTLERFDGGTFTAESGVLWYLLVGTKITVLPGTYTPFIVPPSINDVDIEAWGAGSDTIISGASPLVWVLGSRCRVSGFRFEGSGVAVEISGKNNLFEKNRFGENVTTRYQIDVGATGNHVYDSPENSDKTAYTVSPLPSRGDFVGADETAIQAAVDAASADPQIKRVYLGAGTYTLTSTVNIPANITVFGSGYDTIVSGDGTFPAFTLASGGHQTISGIRFFNFTYSLTGTATGVFWGGNWISSAPVDDTNVTNSTDQTFNPGNLIII